MGVKNIEKKTYVRSFQYKVLNSILFSNELLYKIGKVSNPSGSRCQETRETINHILFECCYSKSFWNEVLTNILNKLSSCRCLWLRDVIIGILEEGMDLDNNKIILGKIYLWTCKQKIIKPNPRHLKTIFKKKYETEKYIAFNSNKINLFNKKWKMFGEVIILNSLISKIFLCCVCFKKFLFWKTWKEFK